MVLLEPIVFLGGRENFESQSCNQKARLLACFLGELGGLLPVGHGK
jgi:hypothetical protein